MKQKDRVLISMMYAILLEQNNIIWDKISGRTDQANRRAEKIIPQILKLDDLLKDWMDEKTN